MVWFTALLTVILVLDCLFLLLLILVQLPKKEAGLGQAFGGAATDALFGAGSGNALTKMTKYATVIFLVLTLSISILRAHTSVKTSKLQANMQKVGQPSMPGAGATTGSNVTTTPLAEQPLTNALLTNFAPQPPKATTTNATPPAASTGTNASTTEKPK